MVFGFSTAFSVRPVPAQEPNFPHESERDLVVIPLRHDSEGLRRSGAGARGAALSLPFFDDFSTPSMPGPGFEGYEMYQRWVSGSARITSTYALNAPTIGCATLDGLDRTGYPYNFLEVNTPGWADTLTSMPIALNGYFPESNIHLMFYVEGGGRGNAPDPGDDELVLEFKSENDVTGEVIWTEVWSTDSITTETFTRVFVPVNQFQWLDNAFQFRFRNWGALAGNVDLWHLDYILLDDQIDPSTFEVQSEVAIIEPVNSFLREFTRMPWNHFSANPVFYMRDSLVIEQRNLSTTQADNIESGFSVAFNGSSDTYPSPFQNTNVLPEAPFTTPIYLGNNPQGEDFVFDTAVSDTSAVFDVAVWQSSIGLLHTEKVGVPDNDSIIFQQVFDLDFAYDDGTAEKAYALTAAGGKLAMRFALEVPDTLLGLMIHFTPYYSDAGDETFLLRAWADSAGLPGAELGENYQFHTPEYFTDGYDVFAYYSYDDPIIVEGSIHVGLVQGSEAMLNFGLDKNTNANSGQLHYQLGLGGAWLNSDIEGTVMIRPIMRADLTDSWVGFVEVPTSQDLRVFPNPVKNGMLQVEVDDACLWRLFDSFGRQLLSGNWQAPGIYSLDITRLAPGTYLLTTAEGECTRFIVE
ncbi:MAG: hypothetical protein CL845_02060 [Crocinitomicaceae bacterium]|nr:hypothetical protein [Crocinitomicaceae bacterium]|tara:strand:- start:386 stop:2293 length:1908 start_codon:yes stop_codon:yes gene_type:complete